MKDEKKLVLGITMGDVNGIGPELILKVFEDIAITNLFTPVIYGSGKALYFYKQQLGFPKFNYKLIQSAEQAQTGKINFIECSPQLDKVRIGTPSTESGLAAYLALQKATEQLLEEKIDAIVTLPIHKKTIQNESFQFPGHTEFFSNALNQPAHLMFMVHEEISLRVAVVTGHMPISEVPSALSIEKVYKKIQIMHTSLKVDFSIERPKIAVLGLNPHAGDDGLLGSEELEIIKPAIERANAKNMIVMGPYPADGFFAKQLWRKFDSVLAMYHDQGLIPFKSLAKGEGVNFTAGLPIVRTSPDHGTAFDIAGKNVASTESFRQAIYLAIDVYRRRLENIDLINNKLKPFIPKDVQIDEDVKNISYDNF